MGEYTEIVHPIGDRVLQIYTGDDVCDRYCLGEEVRWYVDPSFPRHGRLLDGVYDSCVDVKNEEKLYELVVIKDHKVHAIVCVPSRTKDGEVVGIGNAANSLAKMFGIKKLPRSTWVPTAWKLRRRMHDRARRRSARNAKTVKNVFLLPLVEPLYDQEVDPVNLKMMKQIDKEVADRKKKGVKVG